ncbi:LLM class flavin-dependent oxidoreductase [Ferrovibrio sp.]|uniref:LLM class flavin-dependent oxidoreductase n=1 Tax=Ferrovibrio sp. TaxID=1917215 RepID=UPI003D0DBDE0
MKEIRLNAFDMSCVGHIGHGLWTHPRDQSWRYTDLDYWTGLARTLERGLFDGLFLADVVGVYDVYDASPDAALRNAAQVPVNDPLLLVPAMAQATRHLSFGVTCNVSYEQPYLFARRLSTLDHLSKGRIAWNIVTGYLDSAARAMGQPALPAHDSRYDMADDFMAVVYKLWEGSWQDDAVRRDRATGLYADPARVHEIRHQGPHFTSQGVHLSEPSPQRTPVLYQAGSSTRGREFAAKHAECIFVAGNAKASVAETVRDVRARAAAIGRDPADILAFISACVVVAPTEAEAREKAAEYARHSSLEGGLVHMAGGTGIDYARFDWDEPITSSQTNAMQSSLDALTRKGTAAFTKQQLAQQYGIGGRTQPIIGDPGQVADAMIAWMVETDIDGFNLSRTVMPECIEDFVDLVVPELQARGVYKSAYREGSYRAKLRGDGLNRLPASHPAAQYRR